MFDTVLVVSDRNVIDAQLQEALFDFQRTSGVVETITDKDGSKSEKLAKALSGDKKIVVCHDPDLPLRPGGCPHAVSDARQTFRGDRRRGA